MRTRLWLGAVILGGCSAWMAACGGEAEVGADLADSGAAVGGSNATGGSTDAAGDGPTSVYTDAGVALCGDDACACNNGIDDDEDGTIDGLDAECSGPLDNDEGSFATGIPGDNRDPVWQDCFFDGNSGAGDDKCRYHTDCVTGERDATDPDCQVTTDCVDFCGARTPNGCDCFGCCEVQTEDGAINVIIGGACSLESIDDEAACPRCEQTDACGNTCGECELCPGRTEEELPDTCDAPMCEDGQSCTADDDCATNDYCHLGCCLEVVR